jgi:hypothetical protein
MQQRSADNAAAVLATAASTPTDLLLAIAGIVGPYLAGLAAIGMVLVAISKNRGDGKLSREDRFQKRQDAALEVADERETRLLARMDAMEARMNAQGRLIRQMVNAWPAGHPMPRPSDDDLKLLDLDVPFPAAPAPRETETPA